MVALTSTLLASSASSSSSSTSNSSSSQTEPYADTISSQCNEDSVQITISVKFRDLQKKDGITNKAFAPTKAKAYTFEGPDGSSHSVLFSFYKKTVVKSAPIPRTEGFTLPSTTSSSPSMASYPSISSRSSMPCSLMRSLPITISEEVTLDFEIPGLNQVLKGYSTRWLQPGQTQPVPILTFIFDDSGKDSAVLLKYNARLKKTGIFYVDMDRSIGIQNVEFRGPQGETHDQLLSSIQEVIIEETLFSRKSTSSSPSITSYSSMSSGPSMSSSSTTSSMTSSTLEEVSLGYDVAGLEKVFKTSSKCYTEPETYTHVPALLFQFKDDYMDFVVSLNFNDRGRRGGKFSSGGELPTNRVKFTGLDGQSHTELLSIIQTALEEIGQPKSTSLSKSVAVLKSSSSSLI